MRENIVSPGRKVILVLAVVLLGACLAFMVLALLCWRFLATTPPILPSPVPAPDPFPKTDLVFTYTMEPKLGFINADGSGVTLVPFIISSRSLFSSWERPLITGDNRMLIVINSNNPEKGHIFIARAGELAADCNWWGIPRLASDQIHILVETEQGLEKYSPTDCKTGNAPERIYKGIFGALSPDEHYSAEVRRNSEDEPTMFIRRIKTGEERTIGIGDFPAWSRDGKWLAYTGRDGIYVIRNEASAEPRRLVTLSSPEPGINVPVYSEYRAKLYYPPFASWSPDGQWLVYHVYNVSLKDAEYSVQSYSIFKVNVLTGEEIKLIDGGMYPHWRWPAETP